LMPGAVGHFATASSGPWMAVWELGNSCGCVDGSCVWGGPFQARAEREGCPPWHRFRAKPPPPPPPRAFYCSPTKDAAHGVHPRGGRPGGTYELSQRRGHACSESSESPVAGTSRTWTPRALAVRPVHTTFAAGLRWCSNALKSFTASAKWRRACREVLAAACWRDRSLLAGSQPAGGIAACWRDRAACWWGLGGADSRDEAPGQLWAAVRTTTHVLRGGGPAVCRAGRVEVRRKRRKGRRRVLQTDALALVTGWPGKIFADDSAPLPDALMVHGGLHQSGPSRQEGA